MNAKYGLNAPTLLVAALLMSLSNSLSAQDSTTVVELKQVEAYIVKVNAAPILTGKDRIGDAPLGQLIEVSHHRGPWRYARELGGWVHLNNLVLLDEAVATFTADLKKQRTPNSYHLRGIAYMALGDFGRAVNDFEEAYRLGESSVTLHLNLGNCLLQLGLTEKARAEFDRVIKNYPEDPDAYLARGELFLDLGDTEKALADFRQAVKLAPDVPEFHNSLGVAHRFRKEYAAAEQAYSKAIELAPQFVEAVVNRGYARKWLKKFPDAVADYEQAMQLAGNSPDVQNDYAWFLATCEAAEYVNGPRAVELALAACQTTKFSEADFLDTLAAAYARNGQFELAVNTARTAIELYDAETEPDSRKATQQRLELYAQQQAYTEKLSP